MVFLHASKDGATVARMMCQARAKVRSWPACMCSDCATEYNSPEVRSLFAAEHHIDHEWSNAEQQFQDGASETIVKMLGRAVR
eukprot:3190213-Rhodomonas_salina.1